MPNIVSYRLFHSELGSSLCAAGVDVHVACSSADLANLRVVVSGSDSKTEQDRQTIHELDFARGMNPVAHIRAARRLGALVARLKPDVVHAHFDAAIFTTAMARTRQWPATIATFHGMSFPSLTGWRRMLVRRATAWAARRYDTVLVLNSENRDLLQAAVPRADVRLFGRAGVGCDIERFKPPAKSERDAARAKLGFAPNQCVFAYIGRLVESKGFALAVRAFLQFANDAPDVRLLIVGERDALHPTGLTSAEEAALKSSPQVVVAGRRDDVERFLVASDVTVLPSFREGMPVGLMEALATGVPVLTRDVCGCRDVVRHDLDGIVLRDCTVKSIADAMKRLADSPELRRRLSERAIADRERFDRIHFIREQRAFYEDCVARQP